MNNILFLDDIRTPKPEFREGHTIQIVRNLQDAFMALADAGPTGGFREIWLDFDLGQQWGAYELTDNAMPLALDLSERAYFGQLYPVEAIYVHSMNPVGSRAMYLTLSHFGYRVYLAEIDDLCITP